MRFIKSLSSSNPIHGGKSAHFLRRLFHICMIAVPFLYYDFLLPMAPLKIIRLCIIAFIFLVFLLEKLRLRARLVLFGQRQHEATHISAFAWTMLAIGIILFSSPGIAYSLPVIMSCALGDPFMGEMRLRQVSVPVIFSSAILLIGVIWILCSYFYNIPAYWYAAILAPITVAVEWPRLKWIDDNALMLLVPFGITMILNTVS